MTIAEAINSGELQKWKNDEFIAVSPDGETPIHLCRHSFFYPEETKKLLSSIPSLMQWEIQLPDLGPSA